MAALSAMLRKKEITKRKLDTVQQLLRNNTYQANSTLYLNLHRRLMRWSLTDLMGLQTIQSCR